MHKLGDFLSWMFGVSISLPPLLGMLVVGILLKNIPYNYGQFGRAECTLDGHNASFIDSIQEYEGSADVYESSLLDSTSPNPPSLISPADPWCQPRYIGHELDPILSRGLRTLCLAVILLR